MLGLRKSRDVVAGIFKVDELATARQWDWLVKPTFPGRAQPLARQSGGISSPPIKAPILFVAATVCGEAGFCHEDLFMSDSAMPTGCLVAWPGPHANGRSGNSPCVRPPRRALKC